MGELKVYLIEDDGGRQLGRVTHPAGADHIFVHCEDRLDDEQQKYFNFRVIGIADVLNVPRAGIFREISPESH